MATTRRKVLGTATLSFGGTALALGVTSIPGGPSPEIEVDDAAAFGDAVTLDEDNEKFKDAVKAVKSQFGLTDEQVEEILVASVAD